MTKTGGLRSEWLVVVLLSACGEPVVLVEEPVTPILEVVPVANSADCSIHLSWKPPTERTNDSPLSSNEIIRFTLNRFNEETIITFDVNDPKAVGWTFMDMPAGLMSFKVSVTDVQDKQSEWSNVVSKTFESNCG